MSYRRITAIEILSLTVPFVVTLCILIVMFMVLPNSSREQFRLDSVDSRTTFQLMSNNKTRDEEQVPITSSTRSSSVLFILGLIFACGLFVVLVVIVVVVCIWVRQAHGYVVGDEPDCRSSASVARNEQCQLTCHSNHENKLSAKRLHIEPIRNTSKRHSVEHSTFVPLPSPPVKTVALSAQLSCTDLRDDTINNDRFDEPESIQEAQPKNYGTLSRTHLLSSVDEDGYHIDNLGFECDQVTDTDFLPSFDQTESLGASALDSSTQADLNKLERELAESLPECQSSPSSAPNLETESFDQKDSQKGQLTKQDSFQGLPPFKSFDKYLTLVRLDSTNSLESFTLEEIKKHWESIEEGDEERTNIDSVEEKQLQE